MFIGWLPMKFIAWHLPDKFLDSVQSFREIDGVWNFTAGSISCVCFVSGGLWVFYRLVLIISSIISVLIEVHCSDLTWKSLTAEQWRLMFLAGGKWMQWQYWSMRCVWDISQLSNLILFLSFESSISGPSIRQDKENILWVKAVMLGNVMKSLCESLCLSLGRGELAG